MAARESIDKLTGAVIGLANAAADSDNVNEKTYQLAVESLFAAVADADNESVQALVGKVHEEKDRLVPNCKNCASPCGKNADYDMKRIREADEDIRSLKSLILTALEGMAVYAYHAEYYSNVINSFFLETLRMISYDLETEQLISFAMKVGKCSADINDM